MAKGLEIDLMDQWNPIRQKIVQQLGSAVKGAMRQTANTIKKKTIANAKAGIKMENNHPNGEYEQYSIVDTPRVSRLVDKYDEDLYIKVHIWGNGKPHSKQFRFRFLEKGTRPRYAKYYRYKGELLPLKKPRYLGRIAPRWFFRTANQQTNAMNIFQTRIDKAINDINND